jgi:hypothetical protein
VNEIDPLIRREVLVDLNLGKLKGTIKGKTPRGIIKFWISRITPIKLCILMLVIIAYVILLAKVVLPLFSNFYSIGPPYFDLYFDLKVLPGLMIITIGWLGAWIVMLFVDGQYGAIDPVSAKPIIIIFSGMVLVFTGEMFLFLIYAAYNAANK